MRNGDYILVLAPVDYPGTKYRDRYCYEHHLVWWQNTGEVVSEGVLVHHRDRNKHNNVFLNLERLTRASHSSEHGHEKHHGYLELSCPTCGDLFQIAKRSFKSKTKAYGHSDFCCSRSCQVKKQQRDKKNTMLASSSVGS